ncbi:hypothetical protein EI94DRAFT_1794149 [Lactarius quietus]|nr:hypothetical protein EI94DRAFT_1794149 [Lactarius quietus]
MPQPSVLDSSGDSQIPDVAPISRDTSEPEGYPAIKISPPSRKTTKAESQIITNFPQSPLSIQEEEFPQFPTASTEPSTLGPSDPGNLELVQGNVRHSSDGLRPSSVPPSPNQPHSTPYHSQVSLLDFKFPTVDKSGNCIKIMDAMRAGEVCTEDNADSVTARGKQNYMFIHLYGRQCQLGRMSTGKL